MLAGGRYCCCSALLLLLLLPPLQLLTTAEASAQRGVLHVKFVSYSNPSSRRADGHYCDEFKIFKWTKRVSACDPQINLCVGDRCQVGKVSLPYLSNHDVFTFGSSVGSVPNPTSLAFSSRLPKFLHVSSEVFDHDRMGSADLIDRMAANVAVDRKPRAFNINGRTRLQVKLWVSCLPGYRGSRCQLKDFCLGNRCQHGECRSKRSGYLCACQPNWSGRLCDKKSNPCSGRSKTSRHECRVRFRHGKMYTVAILFESRPVVRGSKCVVIHGKRTVAGAEASKFCRF